MPFRYDWAGRLEGADGCVDSIAYSGNDAPTSVACVNGVSATYTLDVRNRIRQIHAINLIAQETALGPGAYVKYYCTTPGMICTPRMMASPWPENPFRLRTQRLQRPP